MMYIPSLPVLTRLMVVGLIISGLFIPFDLAGAAEKENQPEQRLMQVEDRSNKANQPSGAWESMLKFDTPATYRYRLLRSGVDGSVSGSMTVTVAKSYVAFSYELGGVTDGTMIRSKAVAPGEALMAALLASDRWSADDIRLIWTPFMLTRWADQFAQMQWHIGPIWSVRSVGTEEFVIDKVLRDQDGNTIFRGHLTRNDQTVLDVDINLNAPLPEYILWVDRSGTAFTAELVWE